MRAPSAICRGVRFSLLADADIHISVSADVARRRHARAGRRSAMSGRRAHMAPQEIDARPLSPRRQVLSPASSSPAVMPFILPQRSVSESDDGAALAA